MKTNRPGYDNISEMSHDTDMSDKERSKRVSDLLEEDLIVSAIDLVSNGAKLTKKQERDFHNKILASSRLTKDLFENLLKFEIPVDEKYMGMILAGNITDIQSSFNIFNEPKYHESSKYTKTHYPLTWEYLHNHKDNRTLPSILFKGWKAILEDVANNNIDYSDKDHASYKGYLTRNDFFDYKVHTPVTELKNYLFQGVDEKEYNDCISLIKRIPINESSSNLHENLPRFLKEQRFYQVIAEQPKVANNSVARVIEGKGASDFPEDGFDKLLNIVKLYAEIDKAKSNLETEEKFNINNLYQDKLPEIVNNYLSIRKTDKNTIISNQKKSAENVFMEIINDVNDIFEHAFMKINNDKLRDLSVSKEYFSQIKKRM